MDQTLGHLIGYIVEPTVNFIFAKSAKEKEMKHHSSMDARKKIKSQSSADNEKAGGGSS